MKKIIFLSLIFLALCKTNAQNVTQQFYGFNFELFPVKQKVKANSVKRIYYPFTKKLQYIVEYNEFGQRNGMQINYRSDGTVANAVYFNQEKPLYEVVNFDNSNKARQIINKNIYGQFNGKQLKWFLNENNKWVNFLFEFKDGRLTKVDTFNFPAFALNFENGLLNGKFYYYDDLQCSCFYLGDANKGVISSLSRISIDKSLSYSAKNLVVKDNKIYEKFSNEYSLKNDEYEIKSHPIFVQNDQVKFGNEKDNDRVLFSSQMDLSGTLLSRMISSDKKNIDEDTPKQIDMSDASVPAPATYKNK
jgi:hypothetical protein